jgi:putative nucleotidyltransferase with HDIG domain
VDVLKLFIIIAVSGLTLGLGAAVYLRNRLGAANRAFFVVALSISAWMTVAFLAEQPMSQPTSLFLNRLVLVVAPFMGMTLVHFVRVFPREDALSRVVSRGLYVITGAFMAVTLLTDTVVRSVEVSKPTVDIIAGPLLPYTAAWMVFGVAAMVFLMVMKHRAATGRERAQIALVGIGTGLFALAGVLLGLILPMLLGSYAIASLNYLAPLFFLGFSAYAMARHRLMDMRLVVLRLLAYSALVTAVAVGYVLALAVIRRQLAASPDIDPDVLFVVLTLIAVFAFQPLARRIDNVADRYLYRHTYDPQALLAKVASGMTSSLELRELASMLAYELCNEMRLTSAAVVFEEGDRAEAVSAGGDFDETEVELLLDLATEADGVLYADDPGVPSEWATALNDCGVRVLAPLKIEDTLVGVLALGSKRSGDMYSSADEAFLDILAPEAALAVKNAHLYADLEHTFLGTIAALARAADAKDPRAYGQVSEVTEYCLAIAGELGRDVIDRETLRTAALLHDIGEIGVDAAILNKPERLSDAELLAIRAHPDTAADILEPLGFLRDVVPLVRHHHEHWDGSGYPAGLKGEEIPLGARIIAVADAYNAMTSSRPYRMVMGLEQAASMLRADAGRRFDPAVVDALLGVLSRWHGHPVTGTLPQDTDASA